MYNEDMVDNISLKLISELCHNGRLSNDKLAKKLGINVLTVARRIRRLVDEGVITIRALPNPTKMGYETGAFVGLGVDLRKINSVCAQLMENPDVNLLTTCFGRFDIIFIAYSRNMETMQYFIREELSKIRGINHIEPYFILGSERRDQFITDASRIEKKVSLDNIDQQLIIELIRNGRPKYSDLAKKLGVSTSTVSRRIAFLIKEDVIWLRAIPNYDKLDYAANAFVVLRVELGKADKICERLSSYPEIHLVSRLMNGYDILFGIDSANPATLHNFIITRIADIDGVLSSETFMRGALFYVREDVPFLPSTGT
jgi:DNA-binding Lrp family transcriptional regulator